MDRSTHRGDSLESKSRQKDEIETGCGFSLADVVPVCECVNYSAPNTRADSPGVSIKTIVPRRPHDDISRES